MTVRSSSSTNTQNNKNTQFTSQHCQYNSINANSMEWNNSTAKYQYNN